jgi:hypothetical protein
VDSWPAKSHIHIADDHNTSAYKDKSMAMEEPWEGYKLTLRSWRTLLHPSKDGSTLPSTAAR